MYGGYLWIVQNSVASGIRRPLTEMAVFLVNSDPIIFTRIVHIPTVAIISQSESQPTPSKRIGDLRQAESVLSHPLITIDTILKTNTSELGIFAPRKQHGKIMYRISSEKAKRFCDPQVDFLAEHSKILLAFLKLLPGQHVLEPGVAEISIGVFPQNQRFRDLRTGPVHDQGSVDDEEGLVYIAPQHLLLPEPGVVAAADLDVSMIHILVVTPDDEVEELAVELQAVTLRGDVDYETTVIGAFELDNVVLIVIDVMIAVFVDKATRRLGAGGTDGDLFRGRLKRHTQ